jgi:hypothetical protein
MTTDGGVRIRKPSQGGVIRGRSSGSAKKAKVPTERERQPLPVLEDVPWAKRHACGITVKTFSLRIGRTARGIRAYRHQTAHGLRARR